MTRDLHLQDRHFPRTCSENIYIFHFHRICHFFIQKTCCFDCSKADHSDHKLQHIEIAHDALNERCRNVMDNIQTVQPLIGDFNRENDKIAALQEEGERRIALIEKDMRKRLKDEVESLKAQLKASRPQLTTYIADAAPLIQLVSLRMGDTILNHLLNETSTCDRLAQMVDGVIHESSQACPSLLLPEAIQILEPWMPEWISDKEELRNARGEVHAAQAETAKVGLVDLCTTSLHKNNSA